MSLFSFLNKILSDNDKYAEMAMNKIKEDVERLSAESAEYERQRQQWAQNNRSRNVPKRWSLLTGDKGEVQSYSDGDEIHYTRPDGTPMSSAEEFRHLEGLE